MITKNKIKHIAMIITIGLAILSFSSCKTLSLSSNEGIDTKELPKWTITVTQIVKYPRATPGEMEVPTFNSETIWVRKNYEFNSKYITSIERTPMKDKNGYYNLVLNFDRFGSMIAMRLCNDINAQNLAVLVDGVCYKIANSIKPLKSDYTQVEIEGPFDENISNFVVKYSEANYKHLNPNKN